jgi:hypothetical protein
MGVLTQQPRGPPCVLHDAKEGCSSAQGLSLRQQAQLFSRVSVALQIHGASISNWLFMPHNSVAVHIVPRPRPGHTHNTAFAVQWVRGCAARWCCAGILALAMPLAMAEGRAAFL